MALVGRAAGLGGADRGDRGGVHDALDVGPQGLLEHGARAQDVDAEELVGGHPEVRRAGDVEDARDAAQRPPDGAPVGDVGDDGLDVEVLQRLEARGRAHGHADVVAASHEGARDVRADEPGRARDEGGGHRALRLASASDYAPGPCPGSRS